MKVKMVVKFVNDRTLIVHFSEIKPNIRKEKFKIFVEKLEKILNRDLNSVKIVLSPVKPKDGIELEMNWSRFDAMKFILKDFIA